MYIKEKTVANVFMYLYLSNWSTCAQLFKTYSFQHNTLKESRFNEPTKALDFVLAANNKNISRKTHFRNKSVCKLWHSSETSV